MKLREGDEALCLPHLKLPIGETPSALADDVRARTAALARRQLEEARVRAECVARATGPRVAGASCSARDFSLRFENRPAARSFASEARLAALHSGSVAGAFARTRPAVASAAIRRAPAASPLPVGAGSLAPPGDARLSAASAHGVEAARAKLAVADFTRLDERRRRAIEGAAAFVGGVKSSREHGMGG